MVDRKYTDLFQLFSLSLRPTTILTPPPSPSLSLTPPRSHHHSHSTSVPPSFSHPHGPTIILSLPLSRHHSHSPTVPPPFSHLHGPATILTPPPSHHHSHSPLSYHHSCPHPSHCLFNVLLTLVCCHVHSQTPPMPPSFYTLIH